MDIIFPIVSVSVVPGCDLVQDRVHDAAAAPSVRDPGADPAGAPAPHSHHPRPLLHLATP